MPGDFIMDVVQIYINYKIYFECFIKTEYWGVWIFQDNLWPYILFLNSGQDAADARLEKVRAMKFDGIKMNIKVSPLVKYELKIALEESGLKTYDQILINLILLSVDVMSDDPDFKEWLGLINWNIYDFIDKYNSSDEGMNYKFHPLIRIYLEKLKKITFSSGSSENVQCEHPHDFAKTSFTYKLLKSFQISEYIETDLKILENVSFPRKY